MELNLRDLARKDGRYLVTAFEFLCESLEAAVELTGRNSAGGDEQHITGGELLDGLCSEAARLFGPLAAHVWEMWGVKEPLDWGHIVFLLVESGKLRRQESDTLDDFKVEMDFELIFVESYRIELPPEVGPGDTG